MNVIVKYICLFLIIFKIDYTHAQNEHNNYDIYYLVVGSGHYTKDKYKDRLEALNSAQHMATNIKLIHGHGSILLSTADQPITKSLLLKKIYNLKQMIRQEKPKNPLVLFYYMGHGLGSSDYKEYIALGDHDFNFDLLTLDPDFSKFNISDNHSLFGYKPNFKGYTDSINKAYEKFSETTLSADELASNFYFFSLDDNNKLLDDFF